MFCVSPMTSSVPLPVMRMLPAGVLKTWRSVAKLLLATPPPPGTVAPMMVMLPFTELRAVFPFVARTKTPLLLSVPPPPMPSSVMLAVPVDVTLAPSPRMTP